MRAPSRWPGSLACISLVVAVVTICIIPYARKENVPVEMTANNFQKGARAAELRFHRTFQLAMRDREEYRKQSQLAKKDSMLATSFQQASAKLSTNAVKLHEESESDNLKLKEDYKQISRDMRRLQVQRSALGLARRQVGKEEALKKFMEASIPHVQTELKYVDGKMEDLRRAKGLIEKELKKGIREDHAARVLADKSRVELDRYQQQAVHARQEMNEANTRKAILLSQAKVASKKARFLQAMAGHSQGKASKGEIEGLANRYELEASSLKHKASESSKVASLWDAKAKESLTYLTMLMDNAKSAASYVEDVRGLGSKMILEHKEEKELAHEKARLLRRLRGQKKVEDKVLERLHLSKKALQIGEKRTEDSEKRLQAIERNYQAVGEEDADKDKHARIYLQRAWLDDRQAKDLGAAAQMHQNAAFVTFVVDCTSS